MWRAAGRSARAAAAALGVAASAAAQERPGPFIPIGTGLDRLVGWVIADGGLGQVDPLTRPYRLASVRRAVAGQDSTALTSAGRRALGWLRTALDDAADSTAVVAEAGVDAYRNGRRDSFREGGSSGAGALGGIWVSMTRGPWVAVLNPAFENRLKDDPEFTGKNDRFIAGRLQTGYLALTGERGDLFYGRASRDWGPGLFGGLLLSPSAYATDMLAGTLRLDRFELTTVAQRLDDYDTTLAATVTRWFLAHRLTIRAGRGVWLAFTETGVYGGPGRGFDPALHAPLAPGLLAEYNDNRSVNLLWGVEGHVPLGRRMSLEAQGVIDDIQIDKGTLLDRRPWSGGFTVVLRAALPSQPVHASLGYTRVRSLSYRNANAPWEVYAVRGVGIARNFSDYDQLLVRLEMQPTPRIQLTLDGSYLRQGSGDFRQAFPADSVAALPGQGFLVAPVFSAPGARAIVSGELVPGVDVRLEAGATRGSAGGTAWIGGVGIRARFDLLAGHAGGAYLGVERLSARP